MFLFLFKFKCLYIYRKYLLLDFILFISLDLGLVAIVGLLTLLILIRIPLLTVLVMMKFKLAIFAILFFIVPIFF